MVREIIQQVSNTAKPRKQHVKDASVHVCVAASQEEVLCTVGFFPLQIFICMSFAMLHEIAVNFLAQEFSSQRSSEKLKLCGARWFLFSFSFLSL